MALTITAISPATIAELSTTWIRVTGTDFTSSCTWSFFPGGEYATDIVIESTTSALIKSPPMSSGKYSVIVQKSAEKVSLGKALAVTTNTSLVMYYHLIDPVREDDRVSGDDFLKNYISSIQSMFDSTKLTPQDFVKTLSNDVISLEALKARSKLLGLGERDVASLINGLGIADLRRVVTSIPEFWKDKFKESGYCNGINILTGKPTYVFNWFKNRTILGESEIGYPQEYEVGPFGLLGGLYSDDYEPGPNVSFVVVQYPNVTSDQKEIVKTILSLVRPVSERIYIFYKSIFESWWYGDGIWVFTGDAAIDDDNGVLEMSTIGDSATYQSTDLTTEYTSALVSSFNFKGTADFEFKTLFDTSTYYSICVEDNPAMVFKKTISLKRHDGATTTLATNDVTCYDDTYYTVWLTITPDGAGNNTIKYYLDVDEIEEVTDGSPITVGTLPGVSIETLSAGVLESNFLEVYTLPQVYSFIDINES